MTLTFNTCRFCDDRNQSMVKYGPRHYAHFKCYLDAGKKIEDLSPWQIRLFPYFLLKERGLLAVAQKTAAEKDAAIERVMNLVRG